MIAKTVEIIKSNQQNATTSALEAVLSPIAGNLAKPIATATTYCAKAIKYQLGDKEVDDTFESIKDDANLIIGTLFFFLRIFRASFLSFYPSSFLTFFLFFAKLLKMAFKST